jgi:hypothetical protein
LPRANFFHLKHPSHLIVRRFVNNFPDVTYRSGWSKVKLVRSSHFLVRKRLLSDPWCRNGNGASPSVRCWRHSNSANCVWGHRRSTYTCWDQIKGWEKPLKSGTLRHQRTVPNRGLFTSMSLRKNIVSGTISNDSGNLHNYLQRNDGCGLIQFIYVYVIFIKIFHSCFKWVAWCHN